MNFSQEKLVRYPFAAARLEADGRVLEHCPHDHGRSEAEAIACARELRWDGLAELLVAENAPRHPIDVWRLRTHRDGTLLHNIGVAAEADAIP